MIQFLIMIFFIFIPINKVDTEAFSSMAILIKLVEAEPLVTQSIEKVLQNTNQDLQVIKLVLKDIQDANVTINKHGPLKYVGHPINAYFLIKRWTVLITNPDFKDNSDSIPSISEHDLNGSIASIIRLQRVYNLNTDDLARGEIYGHKSCHQLTAKDFLHIGVIALEILEYDLAVQWLKKAIPCDGTNPHYHVYTNIAAAYHSMGDLPKAMYYIKKAYVIDPHIFEVGNLYDRIEFQFDRLEEHDKVSNITWIKPESDTTKVYHKLCQSSQEVMNKSVSQSKHLKCVLKVGVLPYVVYKEEVLSIDPKVAIYHEIISDREAEMIVEAAFPILYRATVGTISEHRVSETRVSKVSWLWDYDANWIKLISQRVAHITGLDTSYGPSVSSAEPFQVINYGIGGQYEPHHDYIEDVRKLAILPDYLLGSGDREATFLLYLSDVQYGGSTVFPSLNVRVPPVKNGAAFWYNLKRSGEQDARTLHAGCPVLLGQKWVCNKWMRHTRQMYTRKCGSTPDDIDT